MHDNLGFFATWLPGDHMAVGAVGVLKDGRFRHEATLKDLGIEIETDVSGSPQTLKYTSTSGTSIKSSAAGEAHVPILKAEFVIEFEKAGAFVFDAMNVQQVRISNRYDVAAQILELYETERWKKKWYVVESLHVAEMATILVSQDRSAGLVLKAQSDVPIGSLALADPKVELSVSSTRGKIVQVLAAEHLNPLYSCLRVKNTLFGRPDVAAVRGGNQREGNMERFTRPGVDELLDS